MSDSTAPFYPLSSGFPLYACIAIPLVWLLGKFFYRFARTGSFLDPSPFPVVGKSGTFDFRPAMKEGNEKYPTSPFIIPFQDPTVIIPASCIEDIKSLPDDQLSTNGSMHQRFAIPWTNSGWVGPELRGSIKSDLARELNDIYPIMQEEIDIAVNKSFGTCTEWTAFDMQPKMVSVVGQVTGRIFVGLPLGRDPRWLKASIEHAITVVMFAARLRAFPLLLRPLIAPFLSERRTVLRCNADLAALITPTINAKKEAAIKREKGPRGPDDIGNDSGDSRLLTWLLQRYKPTPDSSVESVDSSLLIRDHLTLCFAGIHGANYTVVQALFDLATYPEYIQPLRDEIGPFVKATSKGYLDAKAIGDLHLLDSFCKESSRRNPQGIVAWMRKTHKPLALNTGHVVPANTLVATCNPLFNNVLENGDEFDGYRFVKLRSDPKAAGKCNYSSISTDSLIFGYGAHACPGRYLGTSEVKLILAYMLLKFDIRLASGSSERPRGPFHDFMIMLPQAKIELRARQL